MARRRHAEVEARDAGVGVGIKWIVVGLSWVVPVGVAAVVLQLSRHRKGAGARTPGAQGVHAVVVGNAEVLVTIRLATRIIPIVTAFVPICGYRQHDHGYGQQRAHRGIWGLGMIRYTLR